jgi:hypothetical protein
LYPSGLDTENTMHVVFLELIVQFDTLEQSTNYVVSTRKWKMSVFSTVLPLHNLHVYSFTETAKQLVE